MRKQYRPMVQIFYLENLEKIHCTIIYKKVLSATLNNKILNCVAFSVLKQSEEEAAQETTHGNISFDIGRWD